MQLMKVQRTFPKLKKSILRSYSQPAALQNEYSETPEYPPILDMSLQARKLRQNEIIYEKIKNIHTVEEKQIALNMPRYYGWPCVILNENLVPYNALPLVQCYTRTHYRSVEKLPDMYDYTNSTADLVVKEIKSEIADAIALESERLKFNFPTVTQEMEQKEDNVAKCIVKQINRIITNALTDKCPHILSTQVDYDPRHEAFWFVGGIEVPIKVFNWRKQYKWLRNRLEEPLDRPVQYLGSPFLAIRSQLPLKPLLPYSEAENPEFKVPKYTYRPEICGYFIEHRHGTNIPGFWPGDQDEFGLLSIHGRGHIAARKKSYGPEDNLEALHCQALKASFGWLLAQANYQGFTTYNDLTYPLVTQTVITDGQQWSFYAYQLNTIVMHGGHMDTNRKHNICFGTKPLKLFDSIENGVVKGLNEDVLKNMIQFYLNAPEERNYELKPFLGKEEQLVADIEDDNKRIWLENRYKHLVSNRPKHLLLPEIYLWEKIYKIQHNTRFFERKVRPFELGINPYKRKLNEHLPPYIPKVLRPYPKCRKKFETTYYPDI